MTHMSGNAGVVSGSGELAHRIEAYTDGEECTLFPESCSEEVLLTHWITAEEGAFVDLADMR